MGSRLFAAYAAASLVPVVLLGVVLVRDYRREALESGLAQGRAQAAVIEEMAIAPALTGADLLLGAKVKQHLLWRYSIDWHKPNGDIG